MTILVHNESLEWPNGKGFTPCTAEYRRLFDEQMAIYDPNDLADSAHQPGERTLDSLPPADYDRWNELADKLADLQLNGHLLPGERI